MKKIYELLGKKQPLKGDFGIEIECEGEGLIAVDNKYWRSEDDPSLRGRFPNSRHEWVLKKPIGAEDVGPAMEELIEAQKAAKLKFSFRTSNHVHLNIQDMSHYEVLNLIYVYLLLEEPLMDFCGADRKGNRFCLRLRDAEASLGVIRRVFTEPSRTLIKLPADQMRYSSLNLEAIKKYGSVEFRGMRGNMDSAMMTTWTGIIMKLKQYAMSKESVTQIHKEFREKGAITFMREVFGEYSAIWGEQAEQEVVLNYSLTIDIPYWFAEFKDAVQEQEKAAPEVKLKAGRNNVLDNVLIALPHREAFEVVGEINYVVDAAVEILVEMYADQQE